MNKIVVAIPAYNEEHAIYKTLQSVYASNLDDSSLEIYVCLNNCTDHTEDEIVRFQNDYVGLKVIVTSETNEGKVRALKHLDKNINEEIIVFMDADCRPRRDALQKVYKGLEGAPKDVVICSGNSIDLRYSDASKRSTSLIESNNRIFWQHPPRKVINGQLFAARKGIVQSIPNDVIDDLYLSIRYWNQFLKDDTAVIDQGSPQTLYEVLRYQKNISAGIVQLDTLCSTLPQYKTTKSELLKQFEITLSDHAVYYPNIPIRHIALLKMLLRAAKTVGTLSHPTWNQTKSSKDVATSEMP